MTVSPRKVARVCKPVVPVLRDIKTITGAAAYRSARVVNPCHPRVAPPPNLSRAPPQITVSIVAGAISASGSIAPSSAAPSRAMRNVESVAKTISAPSSMNGGK